MTHHRRPAELRADLGPSIRRQRGDVVVTDAPDPDAPNRTIRRAALFDPLRRLRDEGTIETAHWVAAERFRDQLALSQGAREGEGGRLEPWQRCHYAVRVADARAEVEASLQAVGLRLGGIFIALVVQRQGLRAYEREYRIRNGDGAELIRAALNALAQWQAKSGR